LEEYLSHLLRHKDKVTCLYEKYKYSWISLSRFDENY
jgi:hypothetical protein